MRRSSTNIVIVLVVAAGGLLLHHHLAPDAPAVGNVVAHRAAAESPRVRASAELSPVALSTLPALPAGSVVVPAGVELIPPPSAPPALSDEDRRLLER